MSSLIAVIITLFLVVFGLKIYMIYGISHLIVYILSFLSLNIFILVLFKMLGRGY